MVVQDCRGRGKSEGVWDPFRYDAEDGFDTQEWVGQQPWSNGEIGTSGGSYVGWTQWAAAPNASRHLKAMVPVVPFGNSYDLAYLGGAFQLALLMGWGSAVGGVTLSPDKLEQAYHHSRRLDPSPNLRRLLATAWNGLSLRGGDGPGAQHRRVV
jgi:putative CocE/NonD family hydrolase